MKALLLIDIQNDFLPGGSLAVPNGDAIIPVVNSLVDEFDLVVATQDWHPPSHKSFASNHPGKAPFSLIDLNGLEQVLWPDHCVQETRGADLSSRIKFQKAEAIFRKGMDPEIDSYSGFFDNGRRKSTALAEYLKARSVTDVYLCGLAADYCVYFTAIDALKEQFAAYVIEDATRAISVEGFEKAKAHIIETGGEIVRSTNLFN